MTSPNPPEGQAERERYDAAPNPGARCHGDGVIRFNPSRSVPPDPQMEDEAPCSGCPDCHPDEFLAQPTGPEKGEGVKLRYSERELLKAAKAGEPLDPQKVVAVIERLGRMRKAADG